MLLEPNERERRLRIIERGVKEEFWKVVVESLQYRNTEDMQEVIRLIARGDKATAERMALVVQSRQDIMNEPVIIIATNKKTFDEYIIESCKACGSKLKKFKEKLLGRNHENAAHN